MRKLISALIMLVLFIVFSASAQADSFGTQLSIPEGIKIIVEDAETRPIVLVKVMKTEANPDLDRIYDDSQGNKILTVTLQTLEVLSGQYKEETIEIVTTANLKNQNRYIVGLLNNDENKRKQNIKNFGYDPGPYAVVGGIFRVDDSDRVEAPSYVDGEYLGTLDDIRNALSNSDAVLYVGQAEKAAKIYSSNRKKVVTQVKKDDLILLLDLPEQDSSWANILINGQKALISVNALNKSGGYIKAFEVENYDNIGQLSKSVYIYKNPNSKSKKVGVARENSNVIIVGNTGSYYKIAISDGFAYIRKSAIKSFVVIE